MDAPSVLGVDLEALLSRVQQTDQPSAVAAPRTPNSQAQSSPSLSAADGQSQVRLASSEPSTPPSTPPQQPTQPQPQHAAVTLPPGMQSLFAQMVPQPYSMGFAMPQAMTATQPGQMAMGAGFMPASGAQQMNPLQLQMLFQQHQQRMAQPTPPAVAQMLDPTANDVCRSTSPTNGTGGACANPSGHPVHAGGDGSNELAFGAPSGAFAMMPQQLGFPMGTAGLQAGQQPMTAATINPLNVPTSQPSQRNRSQAASGGQNSQPSQKALRKAMKQSAKNQAPAEPTAQPPVASVPSKLPASVASIQLNPKAIPFVPSAVLPAPITELPSTSLQEEATTQPSSAECAPEATTQPSSVECAPEATTEYAIQESKNLTSEPAPSTTE
eukprot:CAMPEP_0176438938 /NCGR_PEP_ID=MMETSP0127-20121128/19618_1 /TAXON_ID=938130 /ORGANISM="Platyophrya macrostoma, Strain WH" /LENGTH=382 /DNA_ID=CAMNT_0017823057 /DNA_START=42 /DNA_END=1191 /DNA_ORIENTATION=+